MVPQLLVDLGYVFIQTTFVRALGNSFNSLSCKQSAHFTTTLDVRIEIRLLYQRHLIELEMFDARGIKLGIQIVVLISFREITKSNKSHC